MTSSTGGFFENEELPLSRVVTWLAHKLWILFPVALTVRAMTYFALGSSLVQTLDTVLTWTLILAFLAIAFHSHITWVCGKCFEDMPDNASEMAERRRLFLWAHHFTRTNFIWVVAIIVILISAFGSVFDPYAVQVLTKIPSDLFLFGFIYSFWAHHRLSLYCPWCKDEGDDERVPEPDPVDKNYVQ